MSRRAHDILKQNIMGAVCARVCPTEVLCEGACVRNDQEHKPVAIGALQRHATDWLFRSAHSAVRAWAETGRRIAVVAAGQQGFLARTVFPCSPRCHGIRGAGQAGGLNEYGVAAYKVTGLIAQREVEYLLEIGGIEPGCGSGSGGTSCCHDCDRITTRCSWVSVWAE